MPSFYNREEGKKEVMCPSFEEIQPSLIYKLHGQMCPEKRRASEGINGECCETFSTINHMTSHFVTSASCHLEA